MNKEQIKAEVTKTLRQVDAAELPAFKEFVKLEAFMHLFCGALAKETVDAIIEAVDEFAEVTE